MNSMRPEIVGQAYSFEDVILEPRRASGIKSRRGSEIDTSTIIARGLQSINLPIISANMDTVTEHDMAETMALHGGIGVIHRFLTPAAEAEEVRKVKDRMRTVEENPPKLPESATVGDALSLLKKRARGYVIVYQGTDFSGQFSGIATPRDFEAVENRRDVPLSQIMTPRERIRVVPADVDLKGAVLFMREHRLQKVPRVDDNGNLLGVYSLKDDEYFRHYPNASLDQHGRLMVGAAVGVRSSDIDRAHGLVDAGVDVLVLDIAHGGLDFTEEMLKRLKAKENIHVPIIAGNVATGEGVIYIKDSGADGVKLGVGPGLVCETRDEAGVGMPQISAIMEAREALADDDYPLIADGGIRKPGDMVKALAAGANAVMIGTWLGGTDKSPGDVIRQPDGKEVKMVRGMASASAFEDRRRLGDINDGGDVYEDRDKIPSEGRTILVPFQGVGSTKKVIFRIGNGLRSGMSYLGAHKVGEIPSRARFRTITGNGANEQRRPLS